MRLIAFTLLLLLLITMPAYAQPVIEFVEMKHAFGAVSQETKPEHFFEFVNRGDQELIIQKVSAS
ncbi:MAG: hypothetical protein C0402_14880 [Thermodesulfovibrio sp.]|nr:hypothetical protein [Thermodesulfovibrio sp.]